MPLEASDFPLEIQAAFFIYEKLSDRWEGMSGTYLGKNLLEFDLIWDMYSLGTSFKKEVIFDYCRRLESKFIEHRMEEAKKARRAEEKKARAGSHRDMAHSVSNHGR